MQCEKTLDFVLKITALPVAILKKKLALSLVPHLLSTTMKMLGRKSARHLCSVCAGDVVSAGDPLTVC